MASPTNGHEFEKALRVCDGQEAWHAPVHGVPKSWTQLRDSTTTIATNVLVTVNNTAMNIEVCVAF